MAATNPTIKGAATPVSARQEVEASHPHLTRLPIDPASPRKLWLYAHVICFFAFFVAISCVLSVQHKNLISRLFLDKGECMVDGDCAPAAHRRAWRMVRHEEYSQVQNRCTFGSLEALGSNNQPGKADKFELRLNQKDGQD